MTLQESDVQRCGRCGALCMSADVELHRKWHSRLDRATRASMVIGSSPPFPPMPEMPRPSIL